MWYFKFCIAVLIDLFDMTVGRLMFATPFLSEIIGVVFGCMMFGSKGLWYALEAVDPTEALDGFVPTATLIALASKDD